MSALKLRVFAEDIRAKHKLVIPSAVMAKAGRLAGLGTTRAEPAPKSHKPIPASPEPPGLKKTPIRSDAPAVTGLERNAFAVLGATPRDSRKRLLELAEEQALHGDEGACNAARAELSNPRSRLAAEVSWLPGAAPNRVKNLLAGLRKNPGLVRVSQGLPALTVANLMVSAIELIDPGLTADEWSKWLGEMADAEEAIKADDVLRDINEERAVAGFPELHELSAVEEALTERRRYYKEVIMAALDRVPSRSLVEAVTRAVHDATAGGHDTAPQLIEEVGAAYELQSTEALEKGATGIQLIVDEALKESANGEAVFEVYVDQIDSLMRRWDVVAQPIQLLKRARGTDHDASSQLAYKIRSLAIHAVNEYGLIEQGQRLTQLLADVFAELPEVVERLGGDADALRDLAQGKHESAQKQNEWEESITYSADVGAVFKNRLSISADGLSWKEQTFSLESITRVRWGAVRHSLNGIPTGTTYTIAFGDSRNGAVCEMRQEVVFGEFIDRLWRAVGFRIALELLKALGEGKKLQFGEALVDDHGVTVPRHAFFGGQAPVYARWSELSVWTSDGAFYIGSNSDKKAYAKMEYLTTDNLHFLETAIRKFFKNPKSRLSQVFSD